MLPHASSPRCSLTFAGWAGVAGRHRHDWGEQENIARRRRRCLLSPR